MNASVGVTEVKKILVFPFDLMSHYLRCIELVKRYPGAEVFFAASKKYDHFVRLARHNTFEVEVFDAAKVMRCAERFDFSWLDQAAIERVFLSQCEAIRKFKPDLVIGDTSPALKMAAELTQVPYTALMNAYMSRYYKCARALPRAHLLHKPFSRLPKALSRVMVPVGEKIYFRIIHRPFRKLRRKYYLKSVADYLGEIEGDENLLCDAAWLFPQKTLPNNYKIIGPLIVDGERNGQDAPITLPEGKPTILVCMGSSGNWQPLSFLSSAPYASFTIVTAGDTDRVLRGDHIIARPFVSLKDILPKCSLLICHGGNGTVYQGLKHKIPMLFLTSHFEQEWNAQRLEELRLGTCINDNPRGFLNKFLDLIKESAN